MALTRYNEASTTAFATYMDAVLFPEIEALVGGGGSGAGFDFFGDGRIVGNDVDAGAPELPASPALAIVLPAGAVLRVAGTVYTLEEDVTLTGCPANSVCYCVPAVDSDGVWSATWPTERPALGAGVQGKVTSDADGVTAIDSSAANADVIPWLPYLLTLIYAGGGSGEGGGGESGVSYWGALVKSGVDPTTIMQAIVAEIEARIGVGQGATVIPPEVRDEVMVNTLHSLALHQMSVNNAFENVPPHHAIVVSPGRGTDGWAYDELTDSDLTTMPVDTNNHEFGSTA